MFGGVIYSLIISAVKRSYISFLGMGHEYYGSVVVSSIVSMSISRMSGLLIGEKHLFSTTRYIQLYIYIITSIYIIA